MSSAVADIGELRGHLRAVKGVSERLPIAQRTVRSLFVSLLILSIVVCEALNRMVPALQYVDEVSFVILALVLVTRMARGVVCREVKLGCLALAGVSCIGFCGNYIFGVQSSLFAIAIDWCSCMKAPVAFLAVYDLLQRDEAYQISYTLAFLARLLIFASAIFGTVSLFVNIGMSGEVRFGLASFSFIFGQQHSLAIILICSLLIIAITAKDKNALLLYFALVAYSMVLTTKGPSLIWVAVAAFFVFRGSERFQFKMRHIVPLVIVAVALGGYQITNYLMDNTSPRYLLISNSIVTANAYLPTGAGFATYGSDMAAKFYSPLYVLYGFVNYWGMAPASTMFLNDNFWPMVIGQFGYVGLVLFVLLFVGMFRMTQDGSRPRYIREFAVANWIYIGIHSLGSASITSSVGVLLLVVLAIAARTNWDASEVA